MKEPYNDADEVYDVTIVGAGMAGLACAKKLFRDFKIRVLEADHQVGGRLRLEGAEFVHGKGTMLTDYLEEISIPMEACCIGSLADGGPHEVDGKKVMYQVRGKLVDASHVVPRTLRRLLDEIFDEASSYVIDISIESALKSKLKTLEDDLAADVLHTASIAFANSALGPLNEMSTRMWSSFETYWDENEEAGDYHVANLPAIAQQYAEEFMPVIELGTPVTSILNADDDTVVVCTSNGEQYRAKVVVVTVPPPILLKLDMDLPPQHQRVLKYIGFDSLIKLRVVFNEPFWPTHVEHVVLDGPIPEYWFKSTENECMATGFVSGRFVDPLKDKSQEELLEVTLKQLASAFQIDYSRIKSLSKGMDYCFDWEKHPWTQGGYAFAKMGLPSLSTLSEPIHKSDSSMIVLAGEVTSCDSFGTIQSAMETGCRAARQSREFLGGGCHS